MARVVDLTNPLSAETPVHPLDTRVTVSFPLNHAKHGMALSSLQLSSHAGTHMDAPLHMLVEGASLDMYPVSRFAGTAVVLDVRERGRVLTAEIVAGAATAAGGLRPGDFALVWSGWDTHYGAPDMYEHPYLTAEAAAYLRDQGVSLVGADFTSMDSSLGTGEGMSLKDMDLSAHRTLMAADVLIVENLRGLEQVAGHRCRCAILPLGTVGVEGSPVRAIAWLEE